MKLVDCLSGTKLRVFAIGDLVAHKGSPDKHHTIDYFTRDMSGKKKAMYLTGSYNRYIAKDWSRII